MTESGVHSHVSFPTWRKRTARARRIASLSVREKRQIFTWMRDAPDGGRGHDLFMPKFGCTMGEFCTWHILAKQVLVEE